MPKRFFSFGHIDWLGEEGQQCRLWRSVELLYSSSRSSFRGSVGISIRISLERRSAVAAQVQRRKADDVETAQNIEPIGPFCYVPMPVAALGVFLVIVFEVIKSIRNSRSRPEVGFSFRLRYFFLPDVWDSFLFLRQAIRCLSIVSRLSYRGKDGRRDRNFREAPVF